MNIKKVSYGLMGAAMMAGVLSSCTNTYYVDKAKAQAVKYLSGDQLLKAERYANKQMNYDTEDGESIAYWDSLLIEAKTKEAYAKGQQLVRDRANKVFNREEKYKLPLDTIFPHTVVENSKNEYAKYSNAEDFIKARDNAPKGANVNNDYAASTHYWNLITMAAKQQEAYEKGIADEKNKLAKKDKIKSDIDPDIKQRLDAYSAVQAEENANINSIVSAYKSLETEK